LRGGWADFQRHAYLPPAPELAPFVSHHWYVAWDLTGQPPYPQLLVPTPKVQLSFLGGAAQVHGVARRHRVQQLAGSGQVFGVAFHPGAFRSFLGGPVSALAGRAVPAAEVFGPDLPERAVAEAPDEHAARAVVEGFLLARLPDRDPVAEQVAEVVEVIAAEPALTRVDALAARCGLGVRQLQRLFSDYVGATPKWVIRRYRLFEVTERLARGVRIDWAELAAELGYADQAHLTRDFTAIIGEPPTHYARRY
jgi:AraC-like DNA-binding protein